MPRGGARPGAGRPKGSKNKSLSLATVKEICEHHKFNPAEKLIAIAKNDDWDADGKRITWPQVAQQKATEKLFDAIHGKTALPGSIDDSDGKQFEIVFIEQEAASLPLSRESSTNGSEEILRQSPFQRLGVSPEDGEDGIRHQYDDTQGLDVREREP